LLAADDDGGEDIEIAGEAGSGRGERWGQQLQQQQQQQQQQQH